MSILLMTSIETNVSNWITAIGTLIAAGVAICALVLSNNTKKNSAFSALFTQLLNNHKEVFNHKELYTKFYETFIINKNQVRTIFDICKLWRVYVDNLGKDYEVEFSHSFKYLYHEVTTVLEDDTIPERTKRRYIGIIQSCLNKDELFCYLINLLQHFETYPDSKDYRKQLKKYHFFDDLLRKHDTRYKDIMEHLSTYLYAELNMMMEIT